MKYLAILTLTCVTINSYALTQPFERTETELRSVKNQAFVAGEKLNYRLFYGPIEAARATLEVKASSKSVKGREILHIIGTGKTKGIWDKVFRVRDTYESYIDKEGIFPWIFIRRVEEGGFVINQDYTFYQHNKEVKTDKNSNRKVKVPANVQDMLSSFYFARTLDFSNAKTDEDFEIETFMDGNVFPLKIRYKGKETVDTKIGKVRCLKFVPILQEGRVFRESHTLTVWLSDDANKIPILASSKLAIGAVKLELLEYENLANPLATVD